MVKSKGWRPLTPDEEQEIIRRYTAGELLTALAEEYRRDKGTLRKVLTEAGVTLRPRGYPKGTVWHDEWRKAHLQSTQTPEFSEKAREATLARLTRVRESPMLNTAIEKRLHDALRLAQIGFSTQSLLLVRFLVDIEIHQAPIVIEADGVTHTLPLQRAKDAERDKALAAAGYRVFRFTGSEINTDAAVCIRHVIGACGLVPDEAPVYNIRTRFAGPGHPRWKGGKREFTCEVCGTKFLAQPKHRAGAHVYCSRACAAEGKRGKPMTLEHRLKLAEGQRRRWASSRQIKIESDPTRERGRPAETTGPATLF